MEALTGMAIFVGAALAGWAVAELKAHRCTYRNNAEEDEVNARIAEQFARNGYEEKNIKDIISTISTTGFSAV